MTTRPEEILGVKDNATPKEVKTRYRALAKRYHPDVNEGDATAEWVFKQIDQAYRVWSSNRRKTDQQEQERTAGSGGRPSNGSHRTRWDYGTGPNPDDEEAQYRRWAAENARKARRSQEDARAAEQRWKKRKRRWGIAVGATTGAFGAAIAHISGAPTWWAVLTIGVFAACITAGVWHTVSKEQGR